MIAHSQSKSQVQAPLAREKKASAFVRAFRKSAAVLTISTAILFSGTINAQDNSSTSETKKEIIEAARKVDENVKKAQEAAKKEAEAAKKEAEAAKKEAEQCKKMKEILDDSEKTCNMGKCDKDDKAWLAEAWKAYVDKCSKVVVEKK